MPHFNSCGRVLRTPLLVHWPRIIGAALCLAMAPTAASRQRMDAVRPVVRKSDIKDRKCVATVDGAVGAIGSRPNTPACTRAAR